MARIAGSEDSKAHDDTYTLLSAKTLSVLGVPSKSKLTERNQLWGNLPKTTKPLGHGMSCWSAESVRVSQFPVKLIDSPIDRVLWARDVLGIHIPACSSFY
jgi:hypothetical protein